MLIKQDRSSLHMPALLTPELFTSLSSDFSDLKLIKYPNQKAVFEVWSHLTVRERT